MSSTQDPREIIRRTWDMLANARRGLADYVGPDFNRKVSGLHNLVVFGRSVTHVLQTLRRVDRARFDAWWDPHVVEIKKEPLMAYFNTLRNAILKEGGPQVGSATFAIEHFSMGDLRPEDKVPPAGGVSAGFFVGDHLGGAGWEITMPDGTVEKYYVALPETASIRPTRVVLRDFEEPPKTFRGQPIPDDSLETLCRLYVDYLTELVEDAAREFST